MVRGGLGGLGGGRGLLGLLHLVLEDLPNPVRQVERLLGRGAVTHLVGNGQQAGEQSVPELLLDQLTVTFSLLGQSRLSEDRGAQGFENEPDRQGRRGVVRFGCIEEPDLNQQFDEFAQYPVCAGIQGDVGTLHPDVFENEEQVGEHRVVLGVHRLHQVEIRVTAVACFVVDEPPQHHQSCVLTVTGNGGR